LKVLLINGSPHAEGSTYLALKEIADTLARENVESEIFHVGTGAIRGCAACYQCKAKANGRCVFDDVVNIALEKAESSDGIILGSPVHYAAPSGQIVSLMHRFAFASAGRLMYKPGAAVVVCRRAGSTAALDQLNKYFAICGMPQVPSQYWNMVHGAVPEDVKQDLEGLQTMRTLARNMAWLLKSIEAGQAAGVPLPEREPITPTNFIR
jgi:multimeric flavodoxin WrbA